MTATDIIKRIEADKIEKHIEPHHALIVEVMSGCDVLSCSIIKAELEELVKENKIKIGDTLNSKYIKIL